MSDTKISPDKEDVRKVLLYLKQVPSHDKDNSSIGSIATSVITNKVKKMEGNDAFRAITDFVSNEPVTCEEAEQVDFDGGSILQLILWDKNIRCQDTGLKYTSYVISSFRSAYVVFDGYPEALNATDNTV